MKKYIPLFLTFLITLCVSCDHSKESDSDVLSCNPEDAPFTINLQDLKDTINSTFKYSEFFSNVRYIPLESRPYATLRSITQLELTNNHDYIVFDIMNLIIIRYDSCGKFLNLVGQRGNGHEEYNYPISITYSKYLNQVLVVDAGKTKIHFFNLDGTYDHSIDAPGRGCNIKVLDENHLIFYFAYSNYLKGYNYLITDNEGHYCHRFERVPDIPLPITPDGSKAFLHDGNEMLCYSNFSNIVYSVSADTLIPRYRLVPRSGKWKIDSPINVNKNTSTISEDSHRIVSIYKTKDNIIMNILTPDYHGKIVIINEKGEIRCYDRSKNDVDNWIKVLGSYITQNRNEQYRSTTPEDFERLYNKMKDDSSVPKEKLQFVDKMSKETNPILQICTLK